MHNVTNYFTYIWVDALENAKLEKMLYVIIGSLEA